VALAFVAGMVEIDIAEATDTHVGQLNHRDPTAGRIDHSRLCSHDRKRFAVDLIVLEQTSGGGLGSVQHRGDQLVAQRSWEGELERGQVGGHRTSVAARLLRSPAMAVPMWRRSVGAAKRGSP
jgi:hypothetical protein